MTSKTPKLGKSPVIFDNTVLSIFALVQKFDVLRKLYQEGAFICRAVFQELQVELASGWEYPLLQSRLRLQSINQALEEGWLQLADNTTNPGNDVIELRLALMYSQQFGVGEAESIALARTRRWVFATDNGRTREFAKQQGICVNGTLGIIVKATEQGVLDVSEADALHTRMVDEGYRSPLSCENGISEFVRCRNR